MKGTGYSMTILLVSVPLLWVTRGSTHVTKRSYLLPITLFCVEVTSLIPVPVL